MNGIFVFSKQSGSSKACQPNSILSLLASSGQADISLQRISPGCSVIIPSDMKRKLTKFFYIMQGCLSVESGNAGWHLSQYDCFYISGVNKDVLLKSCEGARLLCASCNAIFDCFYPLQKDFNELLRITDLKDAYTYGHGKRVMEYSLLIGERLKLGKNILRNLIVAALFHDVGKCYIPDQILRKPARLTPEEFAYIHYHPIHSRTLIEERLGKDIAEIAEQHHERLDGSGYPYGLKGSDIRIESRIIAVADTFDAVTSDRPYRKAKSFSEAVDILLENRGSTLDTRIVNTFSEIFYGNRLALKTAAAR